MRNRILLGAVAVASIATFTACGSDTATTTTPTSITYISTLNGANERPPNASTATGSATYVLKGNILTYTVSVTGLSGPSTAAHIHVGGAAVAGGVIFPFVNGAVATGTVTSGTIDLTQPVVNGTSIMSGDSLKVLLNTGNAYTNVHTQANPGGEVRGQIIKQ